MPIDLSALRPYRNAVFDNSRWSDFEERPGDIFVCTPPKCGTTWTQAIIASLLWPGGDLPAPVQQLSPWIEFELIPHELVRTTLAAQTHRRFMKSHTPADGIPFFADAKYVVVGRDGRDAFMSMCNHAEKFKEEVRAGLNARAAADGVPLMPGWDGDVHGFFRDWLERSFHFEHLASFWQLRDDPRVLLVHFNDLKMDLEGEMRRIAAFLDIPVPESQWPMAVERCTFDAMRERSAWLGAFEIAFEGGAKSFLFKGTNDRWRDVLTSEELDAYAKRVSEFLSPEAMAWMERGRRRE